MPPPRSLIVAFAYVCLRQQFFRTARASVQRRSKTTTDPRRGANRALDRGGQWRVERAKLEEYIQQKYAETAKWVLANPLTDKDPDSPAI